MKCIDLIIAGTQKAGTSSLKHYLSQHPEIASHKQLELTPIAYKNDFLVNYEKYFEEFFTTFSSKQHKILLAKSVSVMSSEKCISTLLKHNSNIKLILVLRNPIDRAFSAFHYAKRMGWERENSFRAAISRKSISKKHPRKSQHYEY